MTILAWMTLMVVVVVPGVEDGDGSWRGRWWWFLAWMMVVVPGVDDGGGSRSGG